VSNENFRRELGHVFDDMAGSPSSALPDRVRSSLAAAPERRGPYWIAGLAAAVIAAIVIGVLVVANPLNHRPTAVVPGAGSSPTPSAAPSSNPSPTATLPVFGCESGIVGPPNPASPPPVAYIDSVRVATHAGYDELTIEFQNGQPTSIDLRPQSGTTFTNSPRGDQVTLAGTNGILMVVHGADLHTSYSGPTDLKTGYSTLVEVRQVEDFEGVVQLGLGVSGAACYSTRFLTNPDRLVIDVQAG
jgi:PPE-repeat protein